MKSMMLGLAALALGATGAMSQSSSKSSSYATADESGGSGYSECTVRFQG